MLNVKIEITDEQSTLDISKFEELVKNVCTEALKEHNINGSFEISLVYTNDENIRQINSQYRNIDSATDVLSFPQFEFEEAGRLEIPESENAVLLGDIVISTMHAVNQAAEYGHSVEREVGYLACHSILHLLGYDHIDDNDKRLMRKTEEKIMGRIGLVR